MRTVLSALGIAALLTSCAPAQESPSIDLVAKAPCAPANARVHDMGEYGSCVLMTMKIDPLFDQDALAARGANGISSFPYHGGQIVVFYAQKDSVCSVRSLPYVRSVRFAD
ncbi:MAG: hypothetical protein ABIH41_04160 [Nanoarchaeota archaeon]